MTAILNVVILDVVAAALVFEHEEWAKTEKTIEFLLFKSFVAWEIFATSVLHEFKMFIHKTLLDYTE
jgi:hypothetical protein